MKNISTFSIATLATVVTALVVLSLEVSLAQVRTSPNYQIQSDSVNIGGGQASSASYELESTVGEIATGEASSPSFNLYAGYQQMQEVFLSLSVLGDVVMTPNLPGITGGTSNGSTTLTVITDSPSGYQVDISAENDPAMQSPTNSISDYDAGVTPDFTFTTLDTDAHFGFSPEGVDIVKAFKDDGLDCDINTQDTTLACWSGLSTTDTLIVSGAGANHPDGATTTLNFRVGIGGSAGVESGVYTATTTVTALPL